MSSVTDWSVHLGRHAPPQPGQGAPWLAALRSRAMDRFIEQGWPTPKQENWHHTSLALLEQQSFSAAAPSDASIDLAALQSDYPGHRLVFVDGRYSPSLSKVGALPSGVRLGSVAQILELEPELIQPYLGDESSGDSPSALNLALAADGAYVRVERGVQLEHPVHLVFVAATAQTAIFPRNVFVLQENSQATVVEHYVGQGGATLTNTVTNGALARDAQLTHIKIQQEDLEAFHLARCAITQETNSVYNSHSMSFGARLARHDIGTQFDGHHCEALLNGLYFVDGRRHVDHNTGINHAQPNGISREFYRGILAGASRGVFTGRILVSPGADGTDAVQRSDSLLLSRMARADARPELEIYADDVKCAHGATVGQIDDDSLFYLRSRGLDTEYAHGLLTYAFAATAVERITLDPVRAHITKAIRSLLPGGHLLGGMPS